MLSQKRVKDQVAKKSSAEHDEDDFYDDDFESFDYVNGINDNLVTPSISTTSTAQSVTPETDSAGNNLNSKGSPEHVDYELLSSLGSEYTYADEEDESAGSQAYDFRLFHESLNGVPMVKQKRFKNGTRASLTFSNQRVRDIERDNQHLLKKIMKSGPTGDGIHNNKQGTNRPTVKSAAEVNRKKKQQQIDFENYLLKRKLDKIASRRTTWT